MAKRLPKPVIPPPVADEEPTLADMLAGKGFPFTVDGVTLYVRQPTTAEFDDAEFVEKQARLSILRLPEAQDWKLLPVSELHRAMIDEAITDIKRDVRTAKTPGERTALLRRARELDQRTLADELAEERAILHRDRYLTMLLLTDANGKPLCPDSDAWETLPRRVKEAARPIIWAMLGAVNNVPFGLAMPGARTSASANGSEFGPSQNARNE